MPDRDRRRPGDDEPRRRIEPLADGISDGVTAGYAAIEHVLAGLRESLALRGGGGRDRPPRPSAARRPAGRTAGPVVRPVDVPAAGRGPRPAGARSSSGALVEDLTRILAELLDTAGDVAQDVARVIADAGPRETDPDPAPATAEIALTGGPGDEAQGEFTFWNTGAVALRDADPSMTALVGARGALGGVEVAFSPPAIAMLGPGDAATVTVTVAVPREAAAGTYRGLVQVEPGGAYAVLTLEVTDGR